MVTLLTILLFFSVVGATWWFGIWNNVLTLVNVLLAGLIASSFYVVLGSKLTSLKHLAMFVSVWLIFIGSLSLLRIMTAVISSRRVKFEKTTELIGQSILSVATAFVFISFTQFTLHLSALPPSTFGSEAGLISPDRVWIGLVQSCSSGSLANSAAGSGAGGARSKEEAIPAWVTSGRFNLNGDFVLRNRSRRGELSREQTLVDF